MVLKKFKKNIVFSVHKGLRTENKCYFPNSASARFHGVLGGKRKEEIDFIYMLRLI